MSDSAHESAQIERIEEKDAAKAALAKERGNQWFQQGNYSKAIEEYTEALTLALDDDTVNKAIYHANRAACYSMLKQWEDTIDDCTQAIELNADYVKAFLRRGAAYEELTKYQEATDDFNAVLKLDPANKLAADSISRIDPLLKAQQEKMKDEMLGKLKELGNNILGKFGLSLNNFKAKQDPSTGAYNIAFEQ